MRMRDWSSDVCSSDLDRAGRDLGRIVPVHAGGGERLRRRAAGGDAPRARRAGAAAVPVAVARAFPAFAVAEAGADRRDQLGGAVHRSEEHTSELQSLMRSSYAVFCLKKKKTRHK